MACHLVETFTTNVYVCRKPTNDFCLSDSVASLQRDLTLTTDPQFAHFPYLQYVCVCLSFPPSVLKLNALDEFE